MFVVLEGLDGSGTTTQTAMLVAHFRATGREAHATREPSDGPVGVMIRQMLIGRTVSRDGGPVDRETLALLFAADRVDHVHNEINPVLAAGGTIVSDRYYHSSLAYQGDVDGDDHFDIAWVRAINARARKPDVTVFLRVPVDVCISRLGDRGHRDIYETREKLERLALRYEQVVDELSGEGERIVVIDGTVQVEQVHAAIVKALHD